MSPRRKPFVSIIRQEWKQLRGDLPPSTRGLLVDLLAEADHKTGTVRASIRWLAPELRVSRKTLSEHLKRLAIAGLVEVVAGSNDDDPTVIVILEFERLTGGIPSGPLSGTPGGYPGGVEHAPATSLLPAAMVASSSSTSSSSISSTPLNPPKSDAALTAFARSDFKAESKPKARSKVFDESDDIETRRLKSRQAVDALDLEESEHLDWWSTWWGSLSEEGSSAA